MKTQTDEQTLKYSPLNDRITPLPWSLGNSPNDSVLILSKSASVIVAKAFHVREEINNEDNAAYIVHCANNYPKLEALNAELIEALASSCDFLMIMGPDKENVIKLVEKNLDLIARA